MWRHGEETDDDDGVVHGDTLHTNILPAHAAEQEKKQMGMSTNTLQQTCKYTYTHTDVHTGSGA